MLLQVVFLVALQLTAVFTQCPIGFSRVQSTCFCTSIPTNITARLTDPVCPEGWRFDGRLCRCQTFILAGNSAGGVAPTTRSCAPGWTRLGNACYLLARGVFSYTTVHNTCNAFGARVVWFSSLAELNQVNALAVASGLRTYWLGMQMFQGRWVWSNGMLPTFFNWRPSQPDNCCGSFVRCALVNFEGTAGQWDDAGCAEAWPQLQGYICKVTL